MLMVEGKQAIREPWRAAAAAENVKEELKLWRGAFQEHMPSSQHSRIDLHILKTQIEKRVGPDRASQYFAHFRNFLASRLHKPELDKLVLLTIGKHNVSLHNQLVKAILNNALHAQVPPPLDLPADHQSKPNSQSVPYNDGFHPPSSNGASSPLKSRRDRTTSKDDAPPKLRINGNLTSPDLSRPLHHLDAAVQQSEEPGNGALMPPVKRLRVLPRLHSTSRETFRDRESDSEEHHLVGNSIKAPLGIPFCTGSVGAARRPPFRPLPCPPTHLLPLDEEEESLDASDLPDADTLHRHIEQIAVAEGLEGVSPDCAGLLNHALDALLKRLIKACVDLVGSKSGPSQEKERQVMSRDKIVEGLLSTGKLHQGINGVCSGPAFEICKDRHKSRPPISLADFKVAMDLNPQQLGEDWPVQLEKISFRIFDQ